MTGRPRIVKLSVPIIAPTALSWSPQFKKALLSTTQEEVRFLLELG